MYILDVSRRSWLCVVTEFWCTWNLFDKYISIYERNMTCINNGDSRTVALSESEDCVKLQSNIQTEKVWIKLLYILHFASLCFLFLEKAWWRKLFDNLHSYKYLGNQALGASRIFAHRMTGFIEETGDFNSMKQPKLRSSKKQIAETEKFL